MIAPDGAVFDNRITFPQVAAPSRIEIHYGHDLRQMHLAKALRDEKIDFGAIECGVQTLDKLAHHAELRKLCGWSVSQEDFNHIPVPSFILTGAPSLPPHKLLISLPAVPTATALVVAARHTVS